MTQNDFRFVIVYFDLFRVIHDYIDEQQFSMYLSIFKTFSALCRSHVDLDILSLNWIVNFVRFHVLQEASTGPSTETLGTTNYRRVLVEFFSPILL